MLSKNILNHISAQLNKDFDVVSINSVGGGSINDAYQLQTTQGDFFVKTNFASRFPGMFEKEARGLCLLHETEAIKIPTVIGNGAVDDTSYLILEWIESTSPSNNFWENFGKKLAQLHQNTSVYFGLEEDNYIGSLHQSNNQHATWEDFFINERLRPQVKLARDEGRMDETTVSSFDKFYRELPNIFLLEAPALLHGDLWSGNFMVGNKGEPVIMDPAVYYGHREMDLAMTKLFGGYDAQLYRSYHDQYPLELGWENRVSICNLYPLMVHVNLFGGSYLQQVKSIVNRF